MKYEHDKIYFEVFCVIENLFLIVLIDIHEYIFMYYSLQESGNTNCKYTSSLRK